MIGALMLFALAALLSAGVVRGRLAFAAHGLDLPGERSLHSRPTPHGGGLGIVVLIENLLKANAAAAAAAPPAAVATPAVNTSAEVVTPSPA